MLHVSTLGQSLIAAGDLRIQPSSARTFATLLYLAAEPGRRFSRAALQAMLFPDLTDASASHSLRQMVYRLRQSGTPIDSRGKEVWVYADRVRRDYDAVIAADRLTAEQLTSIQGGFLPGYAPEGNRALSEWLESYRTRSMLEVRRRVLRELNYARTVGNWMTMEQAARACLALDSLNDEATFGLAEAIARFGSKAAAVRMIEDYLNEIGTVSPDLRVPAAVLRRRISERLPDFGYQSQPDLPFVGRDAEMLLLAEKFQLARRGESQCVVVSGEPGIGKSRLVAEFAWLAALDGACVERTSAQPHDVHRPLGAFIELVPRLLQLPGALGCSPESMAALRRLTGHDQASLAEKAGIATLDAESVFYGITRAIGDLVDAISSERTLILVVEDTHWLDPLSVRVISDLTASRYERRLCVLLTTRDASTSGGQTPHADHLSAIRLDGISLDAAISLIARVIGSSRGEDAFLNQWMASVSCGNPLFIATVTAHYLSTGERFRVPPTLRSLLGKRLEAIDQRTFAVVQMCAVLGKLCTVSRLISCLQMPQIDLLQAVQDAEDRLLLSVDGSRVTISHGLLSEAAVERSGELALRIAHRRAAEVLESETLTVPPTQLWELAEHWVAAAENDRALNAFRACAQHAIEIGRPREAAVALDRALELPLDRTVLATLGRDLVLVAGGCSEFGLSHRGIAAWRAVEAVVDHDAAELAELRTKTLRNDSPDETVKRLLDCAGHKSADAAHRAEAATLLLVISHNHDRPQLAQTTHNLLTDLLDSNAQEAFVIEFSLIYHCMFGDLDEAAGAARQLCSLAPMRPPAAAARTYLNASRVFWVAGLPEEALECCEAANGTASTYGLARLRTQSVVRRAALEIDLKGILPEAESWRRLTEEVMSEFGDSALLSECLTLGAQIAFVHGRVHEGRACLERLSQIAGKSVIERRWNDVLGLRLRQLLGEQRLLAVDVTSLIASATRLPRQEIADTEILIAIEALLARGLRADATQVATDYVSRTRLSRCPLDLALKRLIDKLPPRLTGVADDRVS
jgi:hypothetical protein